MILTNVNGATGSSGVSNPVEQDKELEEVGAIEEILGTEEEAREGVHVAEVKTLGDLEVVVQGKEEVHGIMERRRDGLLS